MPLYISVSVGKYPNKHGRLNQYQDNIIYSLCCIGFKYIIIVLIV